MRAPVSWLRELADLPSDVTGRDLAERLIRAGLEVEAVDVLGAEVNGPLVLGRVESIDQFTASNGKTIRYCQVDVGEHHGGVRGIVCGAQNFEVGDDVIVALPGAVLPGGFAISARKTYGHVSDGMICSARELGIGDDHSGILVLGRGGVPGTDLEPDLGLRDDLLDVAVTPDRGYCMSIRGLARELAIAYEVPFHDPGLVEVQPADGAGYDVVLDTDGCDRFVALRLVGLDPTAASPLWMRGRLHRSGVRPISLAVDVTNYVQLELGQPLHAYDAALLSGAITVREARDGERVRTLDDVDRALEAGDVVIADGGDGADGSRIIGIAGVMGGATTEIGSTTTDVVLEAAHFDPVAVSRTGRRLGLASEAARRFERDVDPLVPPVAAARAARLLVELGGATIVGTTDVGTPAARPAVRMRADHPDRVAGMTYGPAVVTRRLADIGCLVEPAEVSEADEQLVVEPPSWRPDLRQPNDLAEEVIRLEGYENLPSLLPRAPAGRGLTARQRLRRRLGRALAAAGYVEVLPSPFIGSEVLDAFGVGDDDPRRGLVRIANPLSAEEPYLRSTLLADLVAAARRNVGRGFPEVALFESGRVFRWPQPRPANPVVRPGVAGRPTDRELRELDALLPEQPEHVAVVLTSSLARGGWWGPDGAEPYRDAIATARMIADEARVDVTVTAAATPPWHPGRCAELRVGERVVGWAGELHPRVVEALGLPERTAALELDLEALHPDAEEPAAAPPISTYPAATQDLAFVLDASTPAADLEAAIRAGAGSLLEDVRLFDVYTGDQVGSGRKSLAYHLRLRAPDRTLTAEEVAAVRADAVAEAERRIGATLR
jgi:phenylalanyl-tRNA synthetase beta chain